MKKQLLFLLTLLLAITPACKQKDRKMAKADALIASGSTLTAVGAAGTPVAILAACLSAFVTDGAITAGLVAGSFAMCMAAPVALLVIGIPLLVTGIKKKNKLKKQQLLEKLRQEQFAHEQQESEEIQDFEPEDNFVMQEHESE